jgi:3-deoxy-D-manno-octulosonic-acid transferase
VLEALAGQAAVLMTTGTVTSARLLAQRCPGVLHRFVPLDVPRWVDRFLDHWRPDAAAFLESELWPNMLASCSRRGIPLLLLNGRLSARSYGVWARAPGFARHVVGTFDAIWAQSEADAERLRGLGGRDVCSPGNLKFAAAPLPADPAELARLAALLGDRPRWLAASTHPGEETIAATVHRALLPEFPGLLTAIAPRHPERGPSIAAELGAPRRGGGSDPPPTSGLWVADGLGELGLLYRLFPTVFVGKSLSGEGGGQNPLEPARIGCALAAGPAMDNQAEAAAALSRAGGMATVHDLGSLAAWVASMLHDPAARQASGEAARVAASADADLPERAAAKLLAMAARRA